MVRGRPVPVALLLLLVLLALSGGCALVRGGDDGEADPAEGLEILEFGPDPTPVPIEEEVRNLAVSGASLEELNYLYHRQVLMEQLRVSQRDLEQLQRFEGGDGAAGLGWVIDVHDAVHEADLVFEQVLGMDVPEYQRDKHADMYLSELELIQVLNFGAARLLEAATVLGPGGRTADALDLAETRRFQVLVRESGFFLSRSSAMLDARIDAVGGALSGVRLR